MKAIAEFETATKAVPSSNRSLDGDTIIRIEEGLIGFSRCKAFVLMEKPDISPFRMLRCVEEPDVAFVVLNPNLLVRNYYDQIPAREWESLGITEAGRRLAFAIAIIGRTPAESSANLQAPLLLNYQTMTARQVILTDSGLSFRHPLVG